MEERIVEGAAMRECQATGLHHLHTDIPGNNETLGVYDAPLERFTLQCGSVSA